MTKQTKPIILFLCTGNSCRSQMAEGWLRHLAGSQFISSSAGLEAHGLNPRAIATMKLEGIDITQQTSDVVTQDMVNSANVIVTVCGHADEHCPIAPPSVKKIHWPLSDPAKATGSNEAIDKTFRHTCNLIKEKVKVLIEELHR